MINFKRILFLFGGIFLIALSFNLFLLPNNLVVEDVTGISLIFKQSYAWKIETFIILANVFILVISLFILEKNEWRNSAYGAFLMPIMIYFTGFLVKYINISSVDLLTQTIFGGICISFGYRMVFDNGFTTGGTDIVNKVISKIFNISFGASAVCVDGLILLSGGIVFGIETMAYSLIVFTMIYLVGNQKIDDIGENKIFYVNTILPDEIKEYLISICQCDITLIDVEKGYTTDKHKLIMCVVKAKDYYRIKEGIMAIDKTAFITITNSYIAINNNNKLHLAIGKKK